GLAALSKQRDAEQPEKKALDRAALLRLRADDPRLLTDVAGCVEVWPNRAGPSASAKPLSPGKGPLKVRVKINDHLKTVLRFDGRALLEAPGRVPTTGSLFLVYQIAKGTQPGQRLVGWEDANVGRHGLGLMLDPSGRLHAILRNNGQVSD